MSEGGGFSGVEQADEGGGGIGGAEADDADIGRGTEYGEEEVGLSDGREEEVAVGTLLVEAFELVFPEAPGEFAGGEKGTDGEGGDFAGAPEQVAGGTGLGDGDPVFADEGGVAGAGGFAEGGEFGGEGLRGFAPDAGVFQPAEVRSCGCAGSVGLPAICAGGRGAQISEFPIAERCREWRLFFPF